MARTIYALEHQIYLQGSYSTSFLHELDSKDELEALLAKETSANRRTVQRVSRDEAKRWVKRGVTHSTRFWLDGGTVRG